MTYFHILVSTQSDGSKLRCIYRDLSENELTSSFVKPYRRRRNLLTNGEVISLSSLRKVVTSKTEVGCEPLLTTLNEAAKRSWESDLRGSRGVVIFGLPLNFGYDDLANQGDNVTAQFITEAPGQLEKPHALVAALSNSWLVAVGGAVIAAGIGAWLKWN